MIDRAAPIAVIGAGTIGAGIAQVAAVAGHPVILYDAVEGVAGRAVTAIRDRVARLVDKAGCRACGSRSICVSRWPPTSASWRRPGA